MWAMMSRKSFAFAVAVPLLIWASMAPGCGSSSEPVADTTGVGGSDAGSTGGAGGTAAGTGGSATGGSATGTGGAAGSGTGTAGTDGAAGGSEVDAGMAGAGGTKDAAAEASTDTKEASAETGADAGNPVDADAQAIDAPSEAESVTCVNGLSGVGRNDFLITFTLTTTATALSAVVNQRSICDHSVF